MSGKRPRCKIAVKNNLQLFENEQAEKKSEFIVSRLGVCSGEKATSVREDWMYETALIKKGLYGFS
jgi:hypothetical protein